MLKVHKQSEALQAQQAMVLEQRQRAEALELELADSRMQFEGQQHGLVNLRLLLEEGEVAALRVQLEQEKASAER